MQLMDIYKAIKDLAVYDKRSADNSLIEVVFENKDIAIWQMRIESVLGLAIKPAGKKPDSRIKEIADSFGGIRNEQTLFYKSFSEHSLVAMFWPWQNGIHTTCKVFALENSILKE
jgi:hypothetical protein